MESTPTLRVTPLREPDLDRVPQPPSNTEAEQALLGAILINNTAYGRVAEFLAAEHFGNAVHGRIYAAIGKLLDRGQIGNPITLAQAAFKRDGKTVGVATGFVDLDKKLGGLHPSDLIILAGRPSMGKTALATNIAFSAAKAYRPAHGADGRIDLTRAAEDGG